MVASLGGQAFIVARSESIIEYLYVVFEPGYMPFERLDVPLVLPKMFHGLFKLFRDVELPSDERRAHLLAMHMIRQVIDPLCQLGEGPGAVITHRLHYELIGLNLGIGQELVERRGADLLPFDSDFRLEQGDDHPLRVNDHKTRLLH